jgi:three-Cys-motif partner protein
LSKKHSDVSEIGYWSEVKIDILREYAKAYSTILASRNNPRLTHIYVDAFSGAGFHVTKQKKELVWGSPTSVLLVDPPFCEYHFVDLDQGNIDSLREMVEMRTTGPYDPKTVHCYNADCNKVLVTEVFPRVRYEEYKRGLCLLDPYGLHLDWDVVQKAGEMKSMEIFLNFPILDMNRNVLHRDPTNVDSKQIERMTRYWGDESWREIAYSSQGNFFGYEEKTDGVSVVNAFCDRMRQVARFEYVSEPLPMRNSTGGVVYYLIFASQKPVALKIVKDIFNKYRNRTI